MAPGPFQWQPVTIHHHITRPLPGGLFSQVDYLIMLFGTLSTGLLCMLLFATHAFLLLTSLVATKLDYIININKVQINRKLKWISMPNLCNVDISIKCFGHWIFKINTLGVESYQPNAFLLRTWCKLLAYGFTYNGFHAAHTKRLKIYQYQTPSKPPSTLDTTY